MKPDESPDAEVMTAIHQIVEQETGRFGFESLKVEAANDHDGDPILRIAANYGNGGEPVDIGALVRVLSQLCERLFELGEDRFPHIRFHFPEDRKVAG